MKRLDSDAILNIDYKNIERLKMLEKLEEKEDKSFVMAPLCKLRNHCYAIAASCFRNCFSQAFLLEQCSLLERLVADLQMDSMNDFIYLNLIDVLRQLKKDREAVRILFQQHVGPLLKLIHSMEEVPSKRNALIKTLVYLVLKAPDELCKVDASVFGELFKLAVSLEDNEITENILWLQSALLEIKSSEEQHAKAIEICTEFKSAHLYLQCLQSNCEAIVLQALKGLKSLAAIP